MIHTMAAGIDRQFPTNAPIKVTGDLEMHHSQVQFPRPNLVSGVVNGRDPNLFPSIPSI